MSAADPNLDELDARAREAIANAGALVTRSYLIDQLALTAQRVHEITTHHTFPAPLVVIPNQPIWTRAAIDAWLQSSGRQPTSAQLEALELADQDARDAVNAAGGLITAPQIADQLALSNTRVSQLAKDLDFVVPVGELPRKLVYTQAGVDAWRQRTPGRERRRRRQRRSG